MFSSRLPASLADNALTRARSRLEAAGVSLIDLTVSNPTVVGLSYPADVLTPLSDARAATYVPEPLGLPAARDAVAGALSATGAVVSSARVVLTSSTSEAYALLFKLLCDPGDAVLVPQPSYPLLESLARLEGVALRPYRLDYQGAWTIDRPSLEDAARPPTPTARAVVVVSPNNPTGSFVRAGDRDWLAAFAASRGLAVISDEVFADYPLRPRPDASTFRGESAALTFVLGGLSKSAGLPQVKLGWLAAGGPAALVADAVTRLEVIADSYLSVATPVQIAASALLRAGAEMRRAIQARLVRNLDALDAQVARHPAVTLLDPEGGWSAVLRVPATASEEALALHLLESAHVVVHPGYLFDFPDGAFLVVSLLARPDTFDAGLDRLLSVAAAGVR